MLASSRAHYQAHKEEINAHRKEKYHNDESYRERIKAYYRKRFHEIYHSDPDRIKRYVRKYRLTHKEKCNANSLRYYHRNRERYIEYMRAYREKKRSEKRRKLYLN
jgi:hypothetical protein